jgi:hypothetical protein
MACLIVGSAAAGEWWWLQKLKRTLTSRQDDHRTAQIELKAAQRSVPEVVKKSFVDALPSVQQTDEVARDIGRFAQTLGVQIASLFVQVRAPSAREVGKVQFNLAAQADYSSAKAWLAELLARYPSLSVQSLSIRAQPNNAARQDIQLTLVLFVKD